MLDFKGLDVNKIDLTKIETGDLQLFLQFTFSFLENYAEKKAKLGLEQDQGPYMDARQSLILLYEKALNKEYTILAEILNCVRGATHAHMNGTAKSFKRLLQGLKEKYYENSTSFGTPDLLDLIIKDAIKRCEELEKVFTPIYEILHSDATKKEKTLLLKPYWFDFYNAFLSTLNENRYSFAKIYNELYNIVLKEYLKRTSEEIPDQKDDLLKNNENNQPIAIN